MCSNSSPKAETSIQSRAHMYKYDKYIRFRIVQHISEEKNFFFVFSCEIWLDQFRIHKHIQLQLWSVNCEYS